MITRRFCTAAIASFALLAFLPLTFSARAQRVVPVRVPADAVDLGPVPASAPVSVRVYAMPDAARMAALDQLLADQQDPTSPSYHRWLTPAEFGARFGAAANVALIRAFADSQGLAVSDVAASGLRVTLSGTASQIEQAFAPALHAYVASGKQAMANTAAPVVPNALAASVLSVGGLETLTSKARVQGAVTASSDLASEMGDVVDANASPVVAFASTVCSPDISAADQAAFQLEAKQAAAQGITVLATAGCGAASFPAALAEVTAVATAPETAADGTPPVVRPDWQWAPGLPDDGLRHAPDFTADDVSALRQTLLKIAVSMPASADGTPARLGNINATLYKMAPIPTVFTQSDGAAAGTWEPATGLGVVNLAALDRFYPRGSFSVNVSGSASNYAPTHGQSTTLMSTVSDISGQGGGAVPTGTLTFALSTGATLGTATLVNGSGSLPVTTLPGGSNDVIVSYSGDSNYAPGQGYGIFVSVQGEPAILAANIAGSVPLAGTISIAVTASSGSGLGTPTGSVSVVPQGIADMKTYTGALTGSGGTATATVQVPATQAGAIVLLVNCVITDPSFTCYSPVRVTAVVKQASSTLSFTVSPNPPVTGTTTTFAGTVAGAASPAPAPTGMVSFYDNGALLGSAALVTGSATYTNITLTSNLAHAVSPHATTHAFSASYAGDTNYQASNAASPGAVPLVATATTLAVSPNPPVNGSPTTLTATLGYTSSGTAASGTVQFYEDGAMIGTGTVNSAGIATLSSTTIAGTAAHSFTASYLGDSVYAASQSAPVTTQANTATLTTTTSVSTSSTTVNTGSIVTLTGTVIPTSTITGTPATGTVSFISSTQGLLGTATLTGTTASLPVALTTAGAQSITASYSGDANYKSSSSTTPVAVTVGTVITPITLAVTPAAGATYSTPVSAVVSVTGVSTTTGSGPVGIVLFSVATAGTATPITSTVAITPGSTAAGAAVYTFAAPAPGAYTVTATCTGTNFTCTTTPATASLVTVRGATVTTVTATPATLTAGQTTTLTATMTPASPLATSSTFTGTVTFYNTGGVALGTASAVTGNQAILTTAFTSTTGNVITAVYSGDPDWSASTSAPLTLGAAMIPTSATLNANYTAALQGSNVIFTMSVADAPTLAVPSPGNPAGIVTFYDQYNGLSTPLGTGTLTASGPYASVAQLSTTGLFHGLHTVTAIYAGNTMYASSTATTTVNITDYSVSFNPASMTLARGSTGTATVTLASLSGFAGTVSLACTPPPDTLTTCSFSPALVNAGGISTLTIGTTAAHAVAAQRAGLGALGIGVSLTTLLCLLFKRRRMPALLAVLMLSGLMAAAGCGNGGNVTTGGGITSGSPLGTQLFTVVTSGADGVSTNRHTVQFQVTIQ